MERRRRGDPRAQQAGRPVLVGTISIEKSEHLSTLLRRKNVKHVVLNAKYHEQEAPIIAQAGRIGAVTIATNMAGRGVDILLGGNPEYLARERLKKSGADPAKATPEQFDKALRGRRRHHPEGARGRRRSRRASTSSGTERHEARRIDNQLRGRAGRQGDPGSSRFYLSLEDDLMRIFGSDRISGLMARIGMGDGVPIEHTMVTRAIERAQKQVEGQNFTIRKHLLEYDDVMNKQRTTIYGQRRKILKGKDLNEYFLGLIDNLVDWMLDTHANKDKSPEDWDREALRQALLAQFGLDLETLGIDWATVVHDELRDRLVKGLVAVYEAKERQLGPVHAGVRADDPPPGHRRAVEGPPPRDGPSQGRHRAARLRPEGPAHRVQERRLRDVPGHARPDRGGRRALPLPHPAGRRPAGPGPPARRPLYYQQPTGPSGQRSKQARAMIPGKRHKH